MSALPSSPSSPIAAYFHDGPATQAKHLRLGEAIISAIQDGALVAGQKLPGERELSAALGLSLGTTQKALGRLVTEGFLERRHGHGTFVGSRRHAVARGSWHFRFVPPEGGEELPFFSTLTGRSITTEGGPWQGALGPDGKGYVRLDRWFDFSGKFGCASQMYLPATRFGRLMRLSERKLTDANLKEVLNAEFNAPTMQTHGLLKVLSLSPAEAKLLGVASGSPGMRIDIVATGRGNTAISFQRVYVPANAYELKVDFHSP